MFSLNWLVIIWRGGRPFKLDVQGQGDGIMLDVDGQGGWGSWKLDNFHGPHMCIIHNADWLLQIYVMLLLDLVPFVQFKKQEKHPWRIVTFRKVAATLVLKSLFYKIAGL